jgi:hypothetical protein
VTDANTALAKRPKDKFYLGHKADLETTIQNRIGSSILFIRDMISKASSQVILKKKLRLKRINLRQQEEEKKGIINKNSDDTERNDNDSDNEEVDMTYPDECRVLDIMKEKYYEAVLFFNDVNDKTQSKLAVKEY